MKPFRRCVDWRVYQWVKKNGKGGLEVIKEYREWVTGFAIEKVEYMDFNLEIQGCIEGAVRGFRRAIVENRPRFYKPWKPKNSKWADDAKKAPGMSGRLLIFANRYGSGIRQ